MDAAAEDQGVLRIPQPFSLNRPSDPFTLGPTDDTEWAAWTADLLLRTDGVITETIFSWPGMGLTLLNAALRADIPMVIGALVFTGFLALSGHLIADILYAFLDPRIRYS